MCFAEIIVALGEFGYFCSKSLLNVSYWKYLVNFTIAIVYFYYDETSHFPCLRRLPHY